MDRFRVHTVLVLLIVVLLPACAVGRDGDSTRLRRWYIPHYIPLQFAGNIGFVSAGAGYVFNHGRYEVNLLYGYVPASVAETRIHMLTVKNSFPLVSVPLKDSQTLVPYLGVGLTLEAGGNSFFKMPDNFPDSYYDMPKNVHVIAYGGLRLQHLFPEDTRLLRGMELYAEGGTIDLYLWYKATSNSIKFNQIFSLALGVNLLLNR